MCSSEQFAIIGNLLFVLMINYLFEYPFIFLIFSALLIWLVICVRSIFGLNIFNIVNCYKIERTYGLNSEGISVVIVSRAQV
jgi:hypothetical protein